MTATWRYTIFLLIASSFLAPSLTLADGSGILVQRQANQLILGAGDDSPGNQQLGVSVFSQTLPSDGLTQNPSFFSLNPAPVGAETLPAGKNVYWDFLPMTIDGTISNLLYWDGLDAIEFMASQSATLKLHDQVYAPALVDGSATAVAGLRLGTTDSSRWSLHAHQWWWLEGDNGDPPPGIYLAALRLRMDEFAPTTPLFVAFATPDIPVTTLTEVAVPWIEQHADQLIMPGDYNFDGSVDADDYQVWRDQFGLPASSLSQSIDAGFADGNRDGVVDAADYTIWRNHFSEGLAIRTAAIPEPSSLLAGIAGLTGFLWRLVTCNQATDSGDKRQRACPQNSRHSPVLVAGCAGLVLLQFRCCMPQ